MTSPAAGPPPPPAGAWVWVSLPGGDPFGIAAAIADLQAKVNLIMTSQSDMAAAISAQADTLAGLKADLAGLTTSLEAEVQEIKDALANPDQPVTPALQAAADKLAATVTDLGVTRAGLDQAVADVTAVAGPTPPPGP